MDMCSTKTLNYTVVVPMRDGESQIWNFGMVKLKFEALEYLQLAVQIALSSHGMSDFAMRQSAMDTTGDVRQPRR